MKKMNTYRVRGFRRLPHGPERKQFTVLANSFAEAKKFIYDHFYPHIITRISSVSLVVDGKEAMRLQGDNIHIDIVGSVRHVKLFSHGSFRLL